MRIVLEETEAGHTIAITDVGSSTPRHVQPYIFERFYRGDAARARDQDYDGAGFGLSLARWIARVHDGDVQLTDSSETGTTFTVLVGTDQDAAGEAEVEFSKSAPVEQEIEFEAKNLDPGSRVTFVIDGKEIATVTVARDGTAEFEDDIKMEPGSAGQQR